MIMKRKKLYLAGLIALGMASSCDDKLYLDGVGVMPAASAWYLYTNTLGFNLGDTVTSPQTFTVETVNTPWKLNVADEWLKPSPMSGDGTESPALVTVTADINPSTYYRISVFNLESAVDTTVYHYSRSIWAQQEGNSGVELYVSSDVPLYLPAAASSTPITVTVNAPQWSAYSEDAWLSVERTDDGITVTATENATTEIRSGYVYFDVYCQSFSQNDPVVETYYMKVYQSAPGLSATAERLDFTNTAGTKTLTINADLPWAATASDSWISVNPEQGAAGETELTVSVTENGSVDSRSGYVYVQIQGGAGIEIPVGQSGLYIDLTASQPTFEAGGSSMEAVLKTNLSFWSVLAKPDWMTVSPDNGEAGEHTLTFTAEDNPDTAGRMGWVVIGNSGLSISSTIHVEQEGKSFGPLESVMQFENTASSSTLTVTTDGAWTATSANDWITVTPASGTGNAELTVSVAANEGDDERTGRIAVAVGGTVQYVNVVQKGRYFTIDRPTSASLPSTGGTIELGIATNQTWTAEVKNGSPWLTLSATEGTGNANLIISATDNPSLQSRADTVVFTPANGKQGVRLIVRQAGRYLKVSTQSVSFFHKGGASSPVTVETDGTFRVEKPADAAWLTVSTTNNLLVFTAEAYDGEDQRSATVSVWLTGLSGEQSEAKMADITVTQFAKGTQFIREDYGEDTHLEITYKDGAFVTRTDYGEDKDMEGNPAGSVAMDREDYGEDSSLE